MNQKRIIGAKNIWLAGLVIAAGASLCTTGCAKKEASLEAAAAASWNKPTDPKIVADMNAKRQAAEQQRAKSAAGGTAAPVAPSIAP